MKLKEFEILLSNFSDDEDLELRICIPVIGFKGQIGGSKVVDIKSITAGFDWDRGKLFVQPNNHLCVLDEVDSNSIKKLQSEVDRLKYENMRLKQQFNKF
jgi:hypothetical protein